MSNISKGAHVMKISRGNVILQIGKTLWGYFAMLYLRNGKRAACNHGVMDARGRLLSTKVLRKPPKYIHNSMVAQLQRLPFLL